jgi:hypothetical protein
MKKVFLAPIFSFIVLISYSQNSDLVISNTTSNITDISKTLGIRSIVLKSVNANNYSFSIVAESVKLNSEPLNLNSQEFTVEVNRESLILVYSNLIVKKLIGANTILIKTNTKTSTFIDISNINETTFSAEINMQAQLASLLMNEITNKVSQRSSPTSGRKHGTWFVINSGWSSSTASSHTTSETKKFLANNPNCSLFGGTDTSCLWENHLCVSTQYFSCD